MVVVDVCACRGCGYRYGVVVVHVYMYIFTAKKYYNYYIDTYIDP